ncbi:MAG: hypothetical protein KDC34_18705 [Saprospiraceae bacterium]|nr:hypothetical protein [Saprospiraceae bacterium]
MRKSQVKAMLFGLLNAILMLALCLYWLSLPRTFGDEAFFIQWTSLVKKSLFGFDEKPDPNSVFYVDISGSKTLIEKEDPFYQEKTGYQFQSITNREDLANFLQYIRTYGKDIPIVILDITFQHSSPADSLLQAAIDSFPFPLAGASALSPEGEVEKSKIKLPTGIASYFSPNAQFLKYPLYIQDSLPTLPLVALGLSQQKPYYKKGIWPRIDGKVNLINPIIDFKIRTIDLTYGESVKPGKYTIRSLGTLLYEWEFWDAADIRQLLDHKTIIVGDFHYDNHQTIYGIMPGPVIVHNTYLTLEDGGSEVRWLWILWLFFLFFWMSRRIYLEEEAGIRSKWWRRSKTAVGKIIADSIDDSFFLIIGTIFSYLVFNIHINILILLVYLKIVAFILKRFVFKHPAKIFSNNI